MRDSRTAIFRAAAHEFAEHGYDEPRRASRYGHRGRDGSGDRGSPQEPREKSARRRAQVAPTLRGRPSRTRPRCAQLQILLFAEEMSEQLPPPVHESGSLQSSQAAEV